MIHRLLGAMFCALCASASTFADGVCFALKDVVTLDKATTTLGDIAEPCGTKDSNSSGMLGTVVVNDLPATGAPVQLSRERLARTLRRQFPQGGRGVRWQGPDAVVVRRLTVPYSRGVVVEFAERELRRRIESQFESLVLRPLHEAGSIHVPNGAVSLRVSESTIRQLSRKMLVPVEVWLDGAFVKAVPVWFSVNAVQPVLLATTSLPVGHRPVAGDFVVGKVDLTELSGLPLPVAAEFAGQRLKRGVQAGAPLLQSHLEPAPAVARGESVEFEYSAGPIRVEGRGRALSDGRLGQNVRVRSGNNTLLATVVAPGLVAIPAGQP